MLEAKIEKAELLKKVLDAVKELVTDANWDCDDNGMKLQAMDNSHIALVSLELKRETFTSYRCDRNMSLGMNLASLTKILKCAGANDNVKITASDDSDVLGLDFQNRGADRMGQYEMKLMDIDQEHLGIPDTTYDASVTMPSAEFRRIVSDIKELGESVKIEVTKEGVKFSAEGEIGTASVTLRPTSTSTRTNNRDDDDEDEEMEDKVKSEDEVEEVPAAPASEQGGGGGSDDEDEDNESVGKKKTKTKKAPNRVHDSDEEEDVKPEVTNVDSEEERSDAGSASTAPNNKRKANGKDSKAAKKTKTTGTKGKSTVKGAKGKGKKKDGEEESRDVTISLAQSVSLNFSIKYLQNFAKSTPLSDEVTLHLSAEVPLLVQYEFTGGSIKFYLAPKISDD